MDKFGVNLPEREDVEKLFLDMKSIYMKASKRSRNYHNYSELFYYFDLFMEDEEKRSFFMDRLAELVIRCGEAWF